MATLIEQPPPAVLPTAQPPRRLRVLVGAYAVSPVRGSEPGVGWGICTALAQKHDLTILCAPGTPGDSPSLFQQEIEAYIASNGSLEGITLHYVPRPTISRWFQKEKELYHRTVYYLGYKSWQKAALVEARRLHAEKPFDIVHQVNITGFREPGYLWRLPVPFVWGPVAGGPKLPLAYFPILGWLDRVFYVIRNISNEFQKRTAWRCRRAAKEARQIWTVGAQTRSMVEKIWGFPTETMLENGCKSRTESRIRHRDPTKPLRIVWSGVHVGRKALPILIDAIATLGPDAPVEAVILGEGPLSEQWKARTRKLGLEKKITFRGNIPLHEALSEVCASDVMAFTSLQEGTPAAVLESLSLGVPVICHDACGMAVAVDDRCGIKVPMVNVKGSVAGFAAALKRLLDEPQLLGRLSAGALERTAELNWSHKATQIDKAYQRIAGDAVGQLTKQQIPGVGR